MQIWSLDTMGTTTSKVMVSTTTGQTANKIPVGQSTALTSRKTRSAKTTSLLQQTEGTYARTASPPSSRNLGCQVQDFAYTGGACTAVGRCTKEELIEELASTESHDRQGRLSNELTRPGLLVSYKPLDEVDMNQSTKEKRLGALGRGLRREQMQQASKHSGGKRQMVEYASTIHKSHTLTSDQNREPAQKGAEISGKTTQNEKNVKPSSRIPLVQAITTNKRASFTQKKSVCEDVAFAPSNDTQRMATVIESQTNATRNAPNTDALRNVNDSYDPEHTQEKIAQRKLLVGLFKKGAERTANAETSKKETASDGDQTVAVGFSNMIQDLASAPQYSAREESHKSPAGSSLTRLFQSKLATDENHRRDKETKETGNPSTKEAPTKLFGRTALTTNTPQPAELKTALQTVANSSTAVKNSTAVTLESSANEAQNTSKKEGLGRLFNRTGQSTSAFGAARRPMNRSKTIDYSLTTTESTSNTTSRTQDSTTKEGSSTTVEYSLTTTENSTKEPGTTIKKESRTKLFGRIGQSSIASTDVKGHTTTSTFESHTDVPAVSGAQHQTMESHTTAVTVEGHTNEPQTTSMKAGLTKLFGRIGQSSITSTTATPLGQLTSSSGLVSYSASTDTQRSRNKDNLAKFFQRRVNAKTTESTT
ncbi:expressed conserved protein [Echinococcus multilocularis]|uniref:Expressed conserved protein n=1 Tax=Echinococcus multilocularis TaxID=6211 RepID=A0A087W078_ECHMU|nr:expressed conserved protein [Echinococcus multilocularis]